METTATTVRGIYNALEILNNYPGIDEIVNLERAKQFLKYLEENGVLEIPEALEDIKLISNSVIEKHNTSLDDWRELLEDIHMWAFSPDETSEGHLIEGSFWDSLRDDCDTAGFFKFNANDSAEVFFMSNIKDREDCQDKEGTWKEVFEVLHSYYKKYLSVPELPEDDI